MDAIKSWLEQDMRVPWVITHCKGVEEARSLTGGVDVVVLKPEMEGACSPSEVFKNIDDMLYEVPIIVLTNDDGEHGLSTYLMEQGAADVIIRGQFARLVDAIEFALIRQKLKSEIRRHADHALSSSQRQGETALKSSESENVASHERHRQILRMFSGDYAVDHSDKTKI